MIELISGKELNILLRRKGINQTVLSEAIGVNRTQMSGYMNDKHKMPGDILLAIIIYAGLDPKDLVAPPRPEPKTYKVSDSDISIAAEPTHK
jgi:transcriptional regulator with XRE-family HTH domain